MVKKIEKSQDDVIEEKAAPKKMEISTTAPLVCMSCKKRITNNPGSVKFMCPNCGKYEIIRCKHCRQIVAKFTCPICSFTGPN